MAWNQNNPADTEKIRIGPSVIRDNWKAIEENDTAVAASSLNQWVIHLIDRATIGGANTPARIDDIGMIYCRNDGAVNELFFEDSANPANEIQLTEVGKLGSDTTQIVTQDISFGSETAVYNSENIVAYWACVNAAGAIVGGGTGITSALAVNTFTITFSVAQSDANYGVHVTAENNPGNAHTATYFNKLVGSFDIEIVNQNASAVLQPFTVTVYGKRP